MPPSPTESRPSSAAPRALGSLRRAISWHRRTLAVLAAVVAVLAGVSAARPPAPPGRSVLVAAHALAGGTSLTAGDLTARTLPANTVPEQATTDRKELIGRTLVGPVTKGTVFTAADVLAPRLPRSRPGDVIASVPLSDATLVSRLAAGDRVDVLATSPVGEVGSARATARVVASAALLITVPKAAATGPLGTSSGSTGTVVLVEVDAATAARLAQASAAGPLTIVLR